MSEETQVNQPNTITTVDVSPSEVESKIGTVSIRALVVMVLTGTVCAMSGFGIQIMEPLYSAFLLALGYYFGQKKT